MRAILGARPLGGLPLTPGICLGVEIVQIDPFTGGKEAVANIANGPLHASFFIPPRHRHGAWLEAVVSSEFQQGGMETDRIALALEHGAFQIVVEQHPGQSLPRLERRLMPTQKIGHACIEEETQEDPAREAQHHHKGHQSTFGFADGDLPEMSPVDLALLGRQGLQTQVSLRLWAGPVMGNQMAKMILPAAVTALAYHGVKAAGGESWVLLQSFEHKGQVGIDQ